MIPEHWEVKEIELGHYNRMAGLCITLHMGRRLGETLVDSHFAHCSELIESDSRGCI
jgi:hypothetical protein